jgi:hypothetical protein
MKKIAFFSVLIFSAGLLFQNGYAETKPSAGSEEEKRAEIRKRVEEKKQELNGNEWKVAIRSQSGKGSLDGPDTLTFQDGKFRSASAGKKGFTPTNYTITVQEGDSPSIWETMQTNENGNVAFWRGEWKDDFMSGVISRQLEEGKNEEFVFSSSSKIQIPPTSEPKEGENEGRMESAASQPRVLASGIETTPASSAAPRAQAKKEKKGWF